MADRHSKPTMAAAENRILQNATNACPRGPVSIGSNDMDRTEMA